MIALPYDYFLIAWFVLAAGCTAYVAFDQFNGNPEPTVMKWGFILVTLYMGPFGLLLYVLADKEPRPGEHEQFTSPLWKQGVGSTIHCVAGDATGIILAATVTALLGLPMWIDLIVEYVAGFSFGLFIFQSLFMKKMMGGTYWENVRQSFMPEFISMNAMMAGMAPTMSLLMMGRDMRAMDPLELIFWGVMSLGVMVGFVTAFPFNVWMVEKRIKHGLMTERLPGSRFDLAGGGKPVAGKAHAAHARDGTSIRASAAKGAAMKKRHAKAPAGQNAVPMDHVAMAKGEAGGKRMTPVHPMLVHFPIALLVASAFADFLTLLGAGDSLREAGWWALLGAAVSAVFTVRHLAIWTLVVGLLALVPVRAQEPTLELGRAAFDAKMRGQFALAVGLFDRALLEGNLSTAQRGMLYYGRGSSYQELEVRTRALSDLDTAIVLLPEFPNSYVYRALVWIAERRYEQAIGDLNHAQKLVPKDPIILMNLAGALARAGQVDRAIETYDQAIAERPDAAKLYYNRAVTYILKNDREKALSDLNKAIALQPKFADAYENRGVLMSVDGKADQAMDDFEAAISLSPRDVKFRENRANALSTLGRYSEALDEFDSALKIDPGNPALYLGRGRVLLFLQNTDASVEDLKIAVRLRPWNPYPVIWLHIARLHAHERDDVEFAENAARIKRDLWPGPVVDLYLGTSDGEQTLAKALATADETTKHACEADFFVGDYEGHRGDSTRSKELLERVVTKCRAFDAVYSAAQSELQLAGR